MALDLHGFVTPLQDFSGIDRIANTLQDKRQLEAQNKYRQQKEAEQNQLYNLNRIRQTTDFSKYNDVEQQIDKISADELKKIEDKALKEYIGLAPAQMEFLLGNDMQNFIKWHSGAKSVSKKLNEDFGLYKQQNGNVNLKQAYDYARGEFLNDFIEAKSDGSISYKDPNVIQPKDYIGMLNSPEALMNLDVDVSELQKAIESIPKTPVGGKEYTSNKGFSHRFNWSGLKTDFSEVTEDAKGRPTGLQLQTDRVVGGMKLIPQQLKDYLLTQPKVKNAVTKLWANYKQGKNIDPKTEPELFDMFLYEVANKHLPHDIKIEEGNVVPRIYNTTNVNTSSSKKFTPLNLAPYTKVGDDYDITSLTSGIKVTGLPTGQSLAAKQVLFNPDTKKVTYTDQDGKTKQEDFETFRQNIATINTGVDLSFVDRLGVTNRPASTTAQPPKQAAKKEISRKDISTKAAAAWYSAKDYEALLKKNGVIIKD